VTELAHKVAVATDFGQRHRQGYRGPVGALRVTVVVNYSSSEQRAVQTVDGIRGGGGDAVAIRADIAKSTELQRCSPTVFDRYGMPGIVVANAGLN
jgi:3-oxoacyl-[acyl-carrier protein] reductase